MLAEIITIGDEILIGQIVDTNSAIIARELNRIGVSVYQITSVQDDKAHILQALREAESRVGIVIITGGLGPTKDDITKHTLCEFLEDTLVEDRQVLQHIEELFRRYIATPISALNREQAMVPSTAIVLHNAYGTAPGMWMKRKETVFISLPGVQFEMKQLLTDKVIPGIIDAFERPYIVHKTIVTYGLGESAIAERIATWEDNLPAFVRLAYLPNLGKVRLRLTAKGKSRQELTEAVDAAVKELYGLIGEIIYGEEEEDTLESGVARLLSIKRMSLSAAESFTGGRIAGQLTAIPGASAYFKGSIVSYATESKINLLQIPEDLINRHSVVSAEVARAMAVNVRQIMNTDFSVATTGNAGPAKGDSDADIGFVFIAVAGPGGVFAEKFQMGNQRERIVQKSVYKALEMLYKEILKF
jgi:nicotinamide-nucleotide amidase